MTNKIILAVRGTFFLFKKYVKIKNGQRLNYVQNGFFKKVL